MQFQESHAKRQTTIEPKAKKRKQKKNWKNNKHTTNSNKKKNILVFILSHARSLRSYRSPPPTFRPNSQTAGFIGSHVLYAKIYAHLLAVTSRHTHTHMHTYVRTCICERGTCVKWGAQSNEDPSLLIQSQKVATSNVFKWKLFRYH